MNYIELINAFWDKRAVYPLSSSEADFYFYLLKTCNSRKWTNPFKLPTQIIERDMYLNRRSICEIRNKLQQSGYIRFTASTKRGEVTEYEIIDIREDPFCNANRTQTERKPNANRTQSVTQTASPTPPIEEEKEIEISSDEDTKKIGRSLSERKTIFCESVSPHIPKYGQKMIDEFCEYWTREVESDVMRFEKCDKFYLGNRLSTWKNRNMTTKTSVTDIEEKTKLYHIDWNKVKSWYVGLGLVMEKWTDRRKRAYISVFDSYGGDIGRFKEAIMRFGQEVRQSDWILGLAGSPMRDFEWLFTPENFTYVIDGKYRKNFNLDKNGAGKFSQRSGNAAPKRGVDDFDEEDD